MGIDRPERVGTEGAETAAPRLSDRTPERREPASVTQAALSVQRVAGNAATAALLQRMLTVGAVDDPAEREADEFAAQAERILAAPPPITPGDGEQPGMVRAAPVRRAPMPAAGGAEPAPAEVADGIRQAQGRGRAVPDQIRAPLEGSLGVDLSSTRIHTDANADILSRKIQARAFTVGNDLFFRRGEYNPGSVEGRRVLAHEMAHVAQQASGAQRMPDTTIRRITDEETALLLGRAAKLNYALLTEVAAKVPALVTLTENGGDRIEIEGLKQTILTSTVPIAKLLPLIDDPAKLRKKALEKKPQSSGAIFALIDACRSIANDYYRYEGGNAQVSFRQTVGGAAKTYDDTGKKDHDLTHKEKGSGPFGKKKTRTHTMQDVIGKVTAVANIDSLMPVSPTNLPKNETGGGQKRGRVGVIGGGPIGLMAALEARLQGVDVIVFEARGDEYSRRQVLALDKSTEQKLQKLGVKYDLLESGEKGTGNTVAVKYIEKVMRERCDELGIEIRTNWSLVGMQKGEGESQTTASFQIGRGDPQRAKMGQEKLDLVIVAAGAGVAKKNKYTGVCIGDELGIQYEVQEAKDYAVVGLFKNTSTGNTKDKDKSDGTDKWAYRFNTPKVTYILRQIPPELLKEFTDKETGEAKLRAFILDRAKNHFEMGDGVEFAKGKNNFGQDTPNIGVFPIEIIQAKKFVNEELQALVIGDSGATPHPKSGSGYNTGVRELDALSDVVKALQTQIAAINDPQNKRKNIDSEEESPSQVKAALQTYNTEMKKLTDTMVAKAMIILAEQHGKYLTDAISKLETEFGSLLMSDYRLGQRLEGIKKVAESALAKDSKWSKEQQLDFLVQAQRDVANIRTEIGSLKGV